MRTREWEKIIREASVEAFERWLDTLSSHDSWSRGDVCACPLHDFVEWSTGHSLTINSPELSEHWGVRESQTWPTPWWFTWIMRSVDQTGTGKITLADLKLIFSRGVESQWHRPLMTAKELANPS